MKIMVNGTIREMTAEEIAEFQRQAAILQAVEASRPLTESEVSRLLITAQINTLTVDDNTALRMLEYYPVWEAGKAYPTDYKVQCGGTLWRCRAPGHTSQVGWEPGTSTASLWEQINETHTGELSDPIPYGGNMALTEGLYYIQDYAIYRCTRDTINPVYQPLRELVGIYTEEV